MQFIMAGNIFNRVQRHKTIFRKCCQYLYLLIHSLSVSDKESDVFVAGDVVVAVVKFAVT